MLQNPAIGLLVSVIGLVVSVFSIVLAFAAFRRDNYRVIVKGYTGELFDPDTEEFIPRIFVSVVNLGRRKIKLKCIVIKSYGYSPLVDYSYYVRFGEVVERFIEELDDYTVSFPITSEAQEAISRSYGIYVQTVDEKYHKMKRTSLTRIKKKCKGYTPVEVDDAKKRGLALKKGPSLLFNIISGNWFHRHDGFEIIHDHSEAPRYKPKPTDDSNKKIQKP